MQTETATKHTAEPWTIFRTQNEVWVMEGERVVRSFPLGRQSEADALRIVRDHNACAGMENPAKTLAEVRRAMDGLLSNTVSCDAALIAELYRARLALGA